MVEAHCKHVTSCSKMPPAVGAGHQELVRRTTLPLVGLHGSGQGLGTGPVGEGRQVFSAHVNCSAMKLLENHALIDAGPFTETEAWPVVERELHEAIAAVVWPPGSSQFSIRPERMGNGVKPIKDGFITKLTDYGWETEMPFPKTPEELRTRTGPGPFDGARNMDEYGMLPFMVEWETGNVSSSHRALNKIALGLKREGISGGVLVVPSYPLYRFLTDRIGNQREITPCLRLYRETEVNYGYLGVMVVEFDATSEDVPRIEKGTDGRALV